MRNANQVIYEINSAKGDGDEQGLRNTAALLEILQAWPDCPVIHVAGTNGKGSVCAMLSSVLTAAGYKTGLYTSPFLQTYRERIRINGAPVREAVLEKYGNIILDTAGILHAEKGYNNTPFELGTALALFVFRMEHADVIVMETGLGGRLDPTNVIPNPAVCAITAIGMDHMQLLGNTLQEIAREKAGIIKTGVPIICYPQETEEIDQVIMETAADRKAPLTALKQEQVRIHESDAYGSVADFVTDTFTLEKLKISLPGKHQTLNALTALSVLKEMKKQGFRIDENAVRAGMSNTFWPGRLEWFGNILMDGAHNAQGITAFRRFTEDHLAGRRKVLLTGVLTEKLTEEMLSQLCMITDTAVTVTPSSPRAMSADELSEHLRKKGIRAFASNSLKEGLTQARQLAGVNGIVLATGSLYFIGALRSVLGLQP